MSEILHSKSVTMRSDCEIYFSVFYGPKHKMNRDNVYKNVSGASMARVASLINYTFSKPAREIGTSITMYSDRNFGIRRTFYTWSD